METGLTVYHERLSKKQKMVLYFFIFSFLGWILETLYAFWVHGCFVKRGFLYGTLCPIYGFGAVLLIFGIKDLKGNIFVKFLVSMISFSVFEYFVSFLLESAFGLRWWDYTNEFLNINGRVSIFYSVVWGVIGVLLAEKLFPFTEKLLTKAEKHCPVHIQKVILGVFIALFIADTALSIFRYLIK